MHVYVTILYDLYVLLCIIIIQVCLCMLHVCMCVCMYIRTCMFYTYMYIQYIYDTYITNPERVSDLQRIHNLE